MQGNLPDTLEMIRALEDYPLSAVLVLPPYYFKPATAEGLTFLRASARSNPPPRDHLPHPQVRCPRSRGGGYGSAGLGRQGLQRESEYTEALLRANEVCSLGPKTTSGRS